MKEIILALAAVIVIGGAFAVQHMRLQRAEASAALLEKDLAAARTRPAPDRRPWPDRPRPVWTVRRPPGLTLTNGRPS